MKSSIWSGVAVARKPRHSSAKLCHIFFIIPRVFLRLRAIEPFGPACLQEKHQKPVGIAGDPTDNITPEKPILTNALDGAPKRLHLQPVRRLLKRVGPGCGEHRITMAAFIDA